MEWEGEGAEMSDAMGGTEVSDGMGRGAGMSDGIGAKARCPGLCHSL